MVSKNLLDSLFNNIVDESFPNHNDMVGGGSIEWKSNCKRIYWGFVDLIKAFDTVNRNYIQDSEEA